MRKEKENLEDKMNRITTSVAIAVFTALSLVPLAANAQGVKGVSTKHMVTTVDNGVHRSLRTVGKDGRSVGKTIGKTADKAEHTTGKDVRKATKSVGKSADKAERYLGKRLGIK